MPSIKMRHVILQIIKSWNFLNIEIPPKCHVTNNLFSWLHKNVLGTHTIVFVDILAQIINKRKIWKIAWRSCELTSYSNNFYHMNPICNLKVCKPPVWSHHFIYPCCKYFPLEFLEKITFLWCSFLPKNKSTLSLL